jgi:prevent-host-death family protein
MKISVRDSKTKLSKLIPAVLGGEEVIITKSGKPVVKLVPIQEPARKRPLGCYSGKIGFKGDLLAPLPGQVSKDFWPEAEPGTKTKV